MLVAAAEPAFIGNRKHLLLNGPQGLAFYIFNFPLADHTQAEGYRHEMISQFHVTHKSLLGITLARRRKILKTVLTPFLDTLKLSENFVAI